MKKIVSFIFFTICSTYLFAQIQTDQKVDSVKWKIFIQKEWVKDLLKHYQQSHSLNDTAWYSHQGLGGDVYILPQDGMPCFRPDTSRYVYETNRQLLVLKNGQLLSSLAPQTQIPNAIPVKPLIWEKKP